MSHATESSKDLMILLRKAISKNKQSNNQQYYY